MQVTIIGRHADVPADLKRYIEEKCDKLPHYYDRVMAVEVIVEVEQPTVKRVEMVISVAGHEDFVAKEKGTDFFACFDICLDHIEKQLTKHKARVRDHKHQVKSQ